MSDNIFQFPDRSTKQTPAWEALRQFADLLEQMGDDTVEVAACALVPDVGVALCGNSETGNDGMLTMFEIGKTSIVMQYLNGEFEDDDHTIH